MRALSLSLIRGLIDEIEHKIYISWVQPRVLDINQVNLEEKIDCYGIYTFFLFSR
jgi:26S proteasome regulatory subunit N9